MKKKIISLFLACFMFISSTVSSFANPLIAFSPELLGVICTVAVASGIAINSDSELYNVGNMFYQKNKENWQAVNDLFKVSVSIGANKVVTVGNDFLNLCKETFDYYSTSKIYGSYLGGVPYFGSRIYNEQLKTDFLNNGYKVTASASNFVVGDLLFSYSYTSSGNNIYYIFYNSSNITSVSLPNGYDCFFGVYGSSTKTFGYSVDKSNTSYVNNIANISNLLNGGTIAGATLTGLGSYDWENNIGSTYDDLKTYVPGNAGSLVGAGSSDVIYNPSLNPPYDLPTDGIITFPLVDNPSVDLTDNEAIEGDTTADTPADTPIDTVWENIKSFIISLVVPSDAFWTDTFGGLRGSFESAFPMIDMSSFNDLVVGGKPFPNIYANCFGYKCKVVDGDVINSIVDWLRPLVAGFMMLCLMFFNYRKIYKLIRNSEPFGNIAPGTSDFRTGLSAPLDMPGSSAPSNYEIARDQLRDVAFDMRNEILSRKNGNSHSWKDFK